MTNWYTTRGAVRGASLSRVSAARVDTAIEAASRFVDAQTRTRFIPITATRSFRFPARHRIGATWVLPLDAALLAVTAFTDEGDDTTAIAAGDYFLEPANEGPPYYRIEIDLSSSEVYANKDTPQRALRVTGRWGEGEDTEAAGNLNGALPDASGTALAITDGSRIDVGHSLLVESEQLFVSARGDADLAQDTSGDITASLTDTTFTLDGAPTDALAVGEVLRVGSERMRVESITSTTVFEMERAIEGSTLAAHSNNADVFIERSYTIVRGVNGTTGASHADDTAITRYAPPADVQAWCRAEALAMIAQETAAWGREVGSGEGASEFRGIGLARLRTDTARGYRRNTMAAV